MTAKKKAPAKKAPVKKKVSTKPLPKYHLDHHDWDKDAVMKVVCNRISTSSNGLAKICRDNSDLPSVSTVLRWFDTENRAGGQRFYCDMYELAKDAQADYMADEIIEIADDSANDYTVDDEGKPKLQAENVQRARLRVDARKWVAAKLKPRKYGDKLELAGDPERPLSSLTGEELILKQKALEAKLNGA